MRQEAGDADFAALARRWAAEAARDDHALVIAHADGAGIRRNNSPVDVRATVLLGPVCHVLPPRE